MTDPPPPPFPARPLLRWYARQRRRLPWRAAPNEAPDPYRVWLSEIMLQQTTVAAVTPYYGRFLARFPDLATLAAAPEADVLAHWAGLGYYARGRNLAACARAVVARHGGVFPRDVQTLETLPGIGRYTARAVAAIAFGVPTIGVDGNIERIVARLHAETAPLPGVRPRLASLAAALGEDPDARAAPSDFLQALFDLGATVCTPKRPACVLCPWQATCAARRLGVADDLPRKAPRKARGRLHGVVFWLEDAEGRVLLRRRPPAGLFAGMATLPGTAWRETPPRLPEAVADDAPDREVAWRDAGVVRHALSHLDLELVVLAGRLARIAAVGDGFLHPADAASDTAGLPSVMRHCARLAREALAGF